jgi:hypothetical protein
MAIPVLHYVLGGAIMEDARAQVILIILALRREGWQDNNIKDIINALADEALDEIPRI